MAKATAIRMRLARCRICMDPIGLKPEGEIDLTERCPNCTNVPESRWMTPDGEPPRHDEYEPYNYDQEHMQCTSCGCSYWTLRYMTTAWSPITLSCESEYDDGYRVHFEVAANYIERRNEGEPLTAEQLLEAGVIECGECGRSAPVDTEPTVRVY